MAASAAAIVSNADLGVLGDPLTCRLDTVGYAESAGNRYGPATIRDITWWSGLSAADVTTALLATGRPVTAVATPWSDDPCLMFADQAERNPCGDTVTTGVQFLAHEDTALKAYHQTRSRYLAGLPPRCAFNQIGEVLPTVIIDGTVAGTWSWNTRTATISTNLIPGKTTPAIRRQAKARAAALTEALRSAWAPRLPSRVAQGQVPPLPGYPRQ